MGGLALSMQTDRRFMLMKHICPQGVVCPGMGIYSNIFSETAWPIKAKLYVKLCKEEGMKICINGHGHMTKITAIVINSKNL